MAPTSRNYRGWQLRCVRKRSSTNIELSWDTINEKYAVMREKVVMWATNTAEKEEGAVPMDVGHCGRRRRRSRQGRRMSRVRVGGRGPPDKYGHVREAPKVEERE